MKRGKQVDPWFPFFIDKWIFGSTRHELILRDAQGKYIDDLRGIFVDLLVLSKKDDGFIRANESTPYPMSQLAGMFNVPEEKLRKVIEICLDPKVGKMKETAPGIYYINSTMLYDFSDRHRRRVSAKPDMASEKAAPYYIIGEDSKGDKNLLPSLGDGPLIKFKQKHLELAKFLEKKIRENIPHHKITGKAYLEDWAKVFRLMEEADKLPFENIGKVLAWALSDEFWKLNILSADKFRKQYGRLEAKARNGGGSREEAVLREKLVGRPRPSYEDTLTDEAKAELPAIDAEWQKAFDKDPLSVPPKDTFRTMRLKKIFERRKS